MAALSQTGHGNSTSTRYLGVLFWSHNMRLLRYDIHVVEEVEREGGRRREEGGREMVGSIQLEPCMCTN